MTNPDQKTATGKDAVHIELAPPSFTMRVGKRRLTMSWRARKPVPVLLTGLLRRSWRAMFGRGLRISMTAAAICAAWNVPALAAAPPVNTLPTGGVITSGTATITQNGNTLNINQSTQQAIGNFTSFSIGANATVDISQPNSAAAFLARVTGTDPSLIYGHLKANGMVALINQNGIMVGPGGVVDVARFIASTLNITDGDFLAGRLTFNAGATVGNVVNEGTIKTGTGGSVYLIGANVSNSGVIQSPNGEILLAAGQTVQLIDTATPGVTVNVTGTAGSVTNLGTITAEAGRIGIAAGLINNSGNINASSVVSEGGRIFLRASQKLTTTASSRITADGVTKGGSVVLYSDKVAYLDGDIFATGAAGQGGFIETSGKQSLDVVKLPTVGSGGEWYIDPYNLEVVVDTANNIIPGGGNPNVITSDSSASYISASTINGLLDGSTNVTLVTGGGGPANGGTITVSADITKSSGAEAVLTLNADNNIVINANITSTSDKLGLNLNTNVNGATTGTHSAQVNGARIALNGGTLNVSEGVGGNGNGNLSINSGVVNLENSKLATGSLTNGASLTLVNISGSLGTVTNAAVLNLDSVSLEVTASDVTNTGTLTLSNGSTLNAGTVTNSGSTTVNTSTLNVNALTNAIGGSVTLNDSILSATDIIHNAGQFITTNSTINTMNGFTNMVSGTLTMNYLSTINNGSFNNQGLVNTYGSVTFENGFTNTGTVTLGLGSSTSVAGSVSNSGTLLLNGAGMEAGAFTNEDGGIVSGNGSIMVGGGSGVFFNNGIVSPGGDNAVGSLSILGTYSQSGKGILKLDFAGDLDYDKLSVVGPTVSLDGTLITTLLNTYRPTVGTTFTPIQGASSSSGGFRYVEGDIVTSGGVKNMIKAGYNLSGGQSDPDALRLTMSAPEEITYIGNSDSQWGNINSWSTHYIPTAIDSVLIPTGVSAQYGIGSRAESVEMMTLQSGGTFNMSGGNLTVNNVSSAGYFNVTGGVFTLSGTGRFYALDLGGDFNGGSNSIINVTDRFMQSGGSINSAGDVALSMADGDLVVGSITARNLVLESQIGSIGQQDTALHVTKQLLTSSVTGTTLTSSTNRIAAFAGNNRGINDIRLVNNLEPADTSVFKINGVTNANGSISIINTGATATTTLGSNANFLTTLPTAPDVATPPTLAERLTTLGIVTNGTVSAGMLSHTVTIEAHSPLTIGSGGITAAGGIALAAGTQGSHLSNDSLVINGQLVSGGGIINLVAGNSLNINANITGAYTPGAPAPIYGSGVTLNGVLVGPPIQTASAPAVTPPVDTTSQIDRSVNNTQTTTTSTPSISGTNPVIDNTQTTGGGAGSFGGDDSEPAGGQSKPVGNGKKVVKLYCS